MSERIFLEKDVLITDLQVMFDDNFFDYYLIVDGMSENTYITSISDIKVGFGSKYHLHKFIKRLQEELLTEGIIPKNNIIYQEKPTVSEPVVRRLGTKVVDLAEEKRELDKQPFKGILDTDNQDHDTGELDSHDVINLRPTGPMM